MRKRAKAPFITLRSGLYLLFSLAIGFILGANFRFMRQIPIVSVRQPEAILEEIKAPTAVDVVEDTKKDDNYITYKKGQSLNTPGAIKANGWVKSKCKGNSLGGEVLEPDEYWTAVIPTYKRNLTLVGANLRALESASGLKKILLVWNDVDTEPPDASVFGVKKVELKVLKMKKNLLRNRFLIAEHVDTAATYHQDDDMRTSAKDVQKMFEIWRRNPDKIVGIFARAWRWEYRQNRYVYDSPRCHDDKFGSCPCKPYNLILPSISFVGTKYLKIYKRFAPFFTTLVDEFHNGEGIFLNWVVANTTRKPHALWANGVGWSMPIDDGGLSGSNSHYQKRHLLVDILAKYLDFLPFWVHDVYNIHR